MNDRKGIPARMGPDGQGESDGKIAFLYSQDTTHARYSQHIRPLSEVVRSMTETAARNGWHAILSALSALTGSGGV